MNEVNKVGPLGEYAAIVGAGELLDGDYRNSATGARRLPAIYLAATWRNVTPVDDNHLELGVGFDIVGGATVRLSLGVGCAWHLADAILAYLRDHDARTQSSRSSGMPKRAVSTPDECHSRCPPTMSPSASSGEA